MTTVQVIVPNKEQGSRNSSNESLQGLSQSECPICLSDDAENVLIKFAECKHIFCQNCLKEYLMTQINNFKVLKIKCPQDGCKVILQEAIIKEILDEEAFKKYQTLLLQKINNRGAKPQICPKPGCAKKFTASKDSPYTKCACGSLICNVCGEFYHEGKNCLQVLDPEFEIYAKENNLKFCVMCKTVINRVEGCLHITCPVCDYEWCWICGREYKYQHQPKCPRKWDPLPPLQILRENEPKYWWTEIARFFRALAIFLIKLPGRILLWPFWIFHIWLELQMRHFTKAQKCQKLTIGAISSFLYVGLLVLIVFMAISADNSGARIVFFVCLGILIPAPWGTRLISMLNRHLAERKRKKRWLTRDPNAFGYTDAHRPQNQPQNVEAGAPVAVVVPSVENNQSIEVIVHNNNEGQREKEGEKSFERVLPQEQKEPEEQENGSEGSEIPLPEMVDIEEENENENNQEKERGDQEERQSILNIKRQNTSSRLEVSAREVRINVMELQRSVVEV